MIVIVPWVYRGDWVVSEPIHGREITDFFGPGIVTRNELVDRIESGAWLYVGF